MFFSIGFRAILGRTGQDYHEFLSETDSIVSLLTTILGEHGPKQAPAEGTRLDQPVPSYQIVVCGTWNWSTEAEGRKFKSYEDTWTRTQQQLCGEPGPHTSQCERTETQKFGDMPLTAFHCCY